jgi:protein-S-isoprenylcysteine O-methyltransferase Ste14
LAGLALAVLSTALLFWVNWALGANFSTELSIRKDHQLVQAGPYRWVRHPMYTVFFLMFAGFFLLTANWAVGLIPLATLLIVILIRTPREERMLADQFGAEYLRYRERTGRYLPKLG